MIRLCYSPPSSSTLLSLRPPLPPTFAFFSAVSNLEPSYYHKSPKRKSKSGICRAELSGDAPFVVAIGACMLSSLVLPIPSPSEEQGDSAIDSTDTRFAVMGIVSFIPYFNWLSWVFAWLDTGKRRYAVYALVYLAPYLRSNLSLSPEESWLPIASIIFCIVHIQLEASITNGDLQGFQLFNSLEKNLSSKRKDVHLKESQRISEEGNKKEHKNLPSDEQGSRNEIRQWGTPKRPSKHPERLDGDWDNDFADDERRKH